MPRNASGIRRDFWYRYVNQQGFSSLREIPIFSQKPGGTTTLQNFNASIEVTENYGEKMLAYFQVLRYYNSCVQAVGCEQQQQQQQQRFILTHS